MWWSKTEPTFKGEKNNDGIDWADISDTRISHTHSVHVLYRDVKPLKINNKTEVDNSKKWN